MAKLHYLLRSRSDLKQMGPIMARAAKDGHDQTWSALPAKGRVPVRASEIPAGVIRGTPHYADAAFCVYAPDVPPTLTARRIVLVPYFFDFLMPGYPTALSSPMVIAYQTEWARAQHVGHDGPVTGTPIREHLSGPVAHRPMHVAYTMKRGVPERWRHSLRGRWWYFEHLLGERHWARENHLRFVIKTRRKHKDPWWLRALGPVVHDDGAMYPDVSQWLLRDATSMAHFHSGGAVAEAVIQHVPVIRYHRPEKLHLAWLAPSCQPPEEFYRPELIGRDEYLRRFVGPEDASARILEVALGH